MLLFKTKRRRKSTSILPKSSTRSVRGSPTGSCRATTSVHSPELVSLLLQESLTTGLGLRLLCLPEQDVGRKRLLSRRQERKERLTTSLSRVDSEPLSRRPCQPSVTCQWSSWWRKDCSNMSFLRISTVFTEDLVFQLRSYLRYTAIPTLSTASSVDRSTWEITEWGMLRRIRTTRQEESAMTQSAKEISLTQLSTLERTSSRKF